MSAANAIEPNRRTNARAVERCIGFPIGNSPVMDRDARPACPVITERSER
jgi:hypothetical protein